MLRLHLPPNLAAAAAADTPMDAPMESLGAPAFQPNVIKGDFTPKLSGVRAANDAGSVQLPLYGRIAAGLPIEALRDPSTSIEIGRAHV